MPISQKTVLSCRNISQSFGLHTVLKGVTFSIAQGEKIGLVGPNGSGKTTLLKVLHKLIEQDDGQVMIAPHAKVHYFPQIHEDTTKSGGEIAKQVLLPIMQSDGDIFLLDEPTNNLDLDGLIMLEKFIAKSNKTFLIVSHDREFLDRTVTKVIELDKDLKTTIIHAGNYSVYAKARLERIERAWKEYEAKTKALQKYSSSITEKIDWAKKIERKRLSVRKMSIHEKEKPEAAILRDKEGRMARRARIIRERMEQFQEENASITRPPNNLPLAIDITMERRGGTKVFELTDIIKMMGNGDSAKKLGPITATIQFGDRILIEGNNGTGKSTFVKILTEEIKPDSGTITRGTGIILSYLPQQKSIAHDMKVLEVFRSLTGLDETNTHWTLSRYDLKGDAVQKQISQLSPGEYSRFIISTLVANKPNCIILDEPTNHLDLEVLEALEIALQEYEGTLIVVSHDRYFINTIELTRRFTLSKGKIIVN